MDVFVAGASGAIGKPLIAELIKKGHAVTGMTQTEMGAQRLRQLGAKAVIADAFDHVSVVAALRAAHAEIVIDELTSLPKNPSDLPAALPGDSKLRLEGGGNLHRAAQACGVRRYIQQGSAFFLKADHGLADESSPLAVDASPGVAGSAKMYAQLEARTLEPPMEGVVLRYGFFYGPNTWYSAEGGYADLVRQQLFPVIGKGGAVWSWIHIEDAAIATAAALTVDCGIYNIVDDNPSPVNVWLPAFAGAIGAPPPPHVSEEAARHSAGDDAVFYGTRLVGATNAKAKLSFGFAPRRLEWLNR